MRKKTVWLAVGCLMMPLLLSSCGIPQEEHDAVVAERDTAQVQVGSLRSDLTEAESQIEALESDITEAQSQIQALQSDYDNMKYEILERIKQSNLENPSWEELREFLQLDDTDKLVYKKSSFDCTGFALTLRDHAQAYGIRCAFVEVSFSEGEGHAFNAFETTDRGLVYVDTIDNDRIAYVEMNRPYGTIHLDGVKFEYIACSGDPAEFWAPLTYDTHPNPFSYDYYTDYQRRVKFHEESAEAYNKAVADHNKGIAEWSYSDLTTWIENLEALEQDLGYTYEAEKIVRNIQIYWN